MQVGLIEPKPNKSKPL